MSAVILAPDIATLTRTLRRAAAEGWNIGRTAKAIEDAGYHISHYDLCCRLAVDWLYQATEIMADGVLAAIEAGDRPEDALAAAVGASPLWAPAANRWWLRLICGKAAENASDPDNDPKMQARAILRRTLAGHLEVYHLGWDFAGP